MRRILITGAWKGIGLAAARRLLARGARVTVSARDAVKAEKAARDAGSGADWVVLDMDDEASVLAAAGELGRRHSALDVLVNNAAILLDHHLSIETLDPGTLLRTFETNVAGTFRVTKAFLPLLRRSSEPRIVNLSSGAGQLDGEPQAWAPAYSVSKAALNMLTQQMAVGLPGVIVNSMCPGWCRTDMGGPQAPLEAHDGADTLEWLALDAPASLNGQFVKKRQIIPW